MMPVVKSALLIGLVMFPVFVRTQAPSPRDSSAGAGAATIRGRVVDAATGQPLVGVTVSASLSGPAPRSLTGLDGRFELKNLAGGRYRVTASHPGYLSLEFGQTRPRQGGRPLKLAGDQVVENVDFNL